MSTLSFNTTPALRAFKHAWNGILYTFRTQLNFKIHIAAAIAVIALGFVLGLSALEWALVAIVIGNVLVFEVLNTSVEHVVDLIEKKHDINAKLAKDAAAGMVLVSALVALCVGIIIFIPKIL